ncbi:MAG TPA: hypothetical protein VMU64_08370 [Acidimicrobiales bacterium]|nr:hypothetical protein [Acidimicrobiales bacterium]
MEPTVGNVVGGVVVVVVVSGAVVVVVSGAVVVVVVLETPRTAVWLARAWSTPSVPPAPRTTRTPMAIAQLRRP